MCHRQILIKTSKNSIYTYNLNETIEIPGTDKGHGGLENLTIGGHSENKQTDENRLNKLMTNVNRWWNGEWGRVSGQAAKTGKCGEQ